MSETKLKTSRSSANNHYSQCMGGDDYYPAPFGLKSTDGVYLLCTEQQSFWILDIIASYQIYGWARAEEFQVWTLKKAQTGGDTCMIRMTDGGKDGHREKCLVRQFVPFTDFPFDDLTLYLENGVILLPSER